MDIQRQITAARRSFARSLVGRWSTAQGTFDKVMGQHWEIRSNGTGRYIDSGPFGEPRSETQFNWRQAQDFVFELQITTFVEYQSDFVADDDEAPYPWRAIRYDFIIVPTDCGEFVGIIDTAQIGAKSAGFEMSLAPLSYIGPPDP